MRTSPKNGTTLASQQPDGPRHGGFVRGAVTIG